MQVAISCGSMAVFLAALIASNFFWVTSCDLEVVHQKREVTPSSDSTTHFHHRARHSCESPNPSKAKMRFTTDRHI